ncbi:FAD:protein FMN transferase [Arenimonas composti]|uniref:FAD:protein FMN transferase n=1 Tax=Arenimonas composti TR7-09 = DSM 18010 TaxID=1121013 RepID=A0A091BFF8_9GAMM|nr:FAD:protein FMN transferase [Arenimonas composti]KFN49539.1 hypothetical protein P873_10320 [Arenimonas composti TR7-09 = DSM 18010]
MRALSPRPDATDRRRPRWFIVSACLLLAALLAGCASLPPAPATLQGESMGSVWTVKLAADLDDATRARLQRAIQQELDRVVAQMSPWEADSDISRFNRAPAGSVQVLAPGFAHVLAAALELARDTGGAYDPTIGPLVDLWGFGPAGRRSAPPPEDEIAAARARVGWQRLAFDPATRELGQPGGVGLDLSSIATGFGVDQVARRLQAEGFADFLIELGGELRAAGTRGGAPWTVGIERPPLDLTAGADDAAALLTAIPLRDMAIGNSGDARNFFVRDGARYSHHLDPRTGVPVDSRLAMVTVLHPECMQADALAMAITALGADAGYAWAEARGLAALLVVREGDRLVERATPAFAAVLPR